MVVHVGSNITVNGSLNDAVNVAPVLPAKYTRKLPVTWSPERYEAVVGRYLGTVRGSKVGSAVLSKLARPLTIRPWIWNPPNAAAIPLARLHATERDKPVGGGAGVRGTGRGTPVTIWFLPANREIPDATLLHECVHAMRMTRGALTSYDYPANFHREEEYFAILITNIFQSELKRKLIRIDHKGNSWTEVKSPWDHFRVDPFLITAFGMKHSSLALEIGRVKAEFNPFSPDFSDKVKAN